METVKLFIVLLKESENILPNETYEYFRTAFFAILHTSLAIVLYYCRYKSTVQSQFQ
jgi:hypothetical protein